MRIAFPVILLLAVAPPAPAADTFETRPTISGAAVALDGDTILVAGKRVRLWGIDAPEMKDWPLGAHARAALDRLLRSGDGVNCAVIDRDKYKRPVAQCVTRLAFFFGDTRDRVDLAAAMVGSGRAVVYRRYTAKANNAWLERLAERYDTLEARAVKARHGIWKDFGGVRFLEGQAGTANREAGRKGQ